MSKVVRRISKEAAIVVALLGVALASRSVWIGMRFERLNVDRDAYLAISEQLSLGHGFSSDARAIPTAYRPPLYPLILAGLRCLPMQLPVAIAVLHLSLAVGTVVLTLRVGDALGLGKLRFLAAGIVALDPLLIHYCVQPMTETTCAFLVTWCLLSFVRLFQGDHSWRRQAQAGVALGLAALCRPTVWAFAVLMAVAFAVRAIVRPSELRTTGVRPFLGRLPWTTCLAAVLVVAPWAVRNAIVFGRPIVTTTHGGYTLLLGNNAVFYREVVRGPWGTVWGGESLSAWQHSLEADLRASGIAPADEIERDRQLAAQARYTITHDPATFVQACWLRARRFFNITPLTSGDASLPSFVLFAVGGFNAIVLLTAALGTLRLRRLRNLGWVPVLFVLTSFVLVHLVYWSNARMRGPVAPAIALLAAAALRRHSASFAESRRAGP